MLSIIILMIFTWSQSPTPVLKLSLKKIRFWTGFPHLVRPGLPVGLLSKAPQRFLWRSLRRLLSRFTALLDLRHYCHQSNHRRITMIIDHNHPHITMIMILHHNPPLFSWVFPPPPQAAPRPVERGRQSNGGSASSPEILEDFWVGSDYWHLGCCYCHGRFQSILLTLEIPVIFWAVVTFESSDALQTGELSDFLTTNTQDLRLHL